MSQIKLFNSETYVSRRKTLARSLGSGKILLLGNNESSVNFRDNWYPFRQDSTFIYYFGISLPGLNAVIDCESGDSNIYGDDLTIDDIVWTGPQPTIADLAAQVGVTRTLPSSRLTGDLTGHDVHFLPPYRSDHTLFLSETLGQPVGEIQEGYSVLLINEVVNQRAYKTPEEIEEIDKAVSITSEMHLAVMKATRPGMMEHELVGVAAKVMHEHNVAFSFPPILTTDGQTLHNHYHGNRIEEGQMLLFDGGTESTSCYAGDMTRTFPVGASFDSRQKALYDIVYQAHRSAIDALTPGVRFKDIHLLAGKKLVEGLIDVGIMKGSADDAVDAGAHTMFFQCGLGHMMGLDVHDMENLGEQYVGYTPDLIKSTEFGLKSLRLGRALEPGFVLTVEPGIYIIPELIDMNKAAKKYLDFMNYGELEKFRDFGGIRVEDDFVITENGADLLGTPLAGSSDEIEKVRKAALS